MSPSALYLLLSLSVPPSLSWTAAPRPVRSPPPTLRSTSEAASGGGGGGVGGGAGGGGGYPSDSNVVLRPARDDPSAFDSHSIGTPRVHRYVRGLDGPDLAGGGVDRDAEYVMWYHGRCSSLNDAESALPPLSTGRIGRATSRNGLVWEKCPIGSNSEEGEGVALGLNTDSWWGFDTAHVGLGQVMLPMTTPAVLAEGGVYLMYYMGGDHQETFVSSYLDDPGAVPDDATIRGMTLKIGVAMSQDGMTWGRVEGDDPTGACMGPYDKSDPNMRGMESMRDDDDSILNIEEELYCGWPEVVVGEIYDDASGSGRKPPAFFMYYSTMVKDTKEKAIGCAVSGDGFRWSKRGICLRPSDDGPDAGGCARCTVVRKANYDDERGEWSDARDGWVMYYEGVSREDGKHRVMAAESADGRVWRKVGLVLDVGEGDDAWDCDGVGSPHILRMDDGTARMYYTGQGRDGSTAIGVAKCIDGGSADAPFLRERARFSIA